MEKTKEQLEQVLGNLPAGGDTNYHNMTYEQGIEETILWLMGEISDEEFEYLNRKQ